MSDVNLSAGATEQTSPTNSQPNAEKSGTVENSFTPEQTAFVQNLVKQALREQAKHSQFANQRREAEGKNQKQALNKPNDESLTLRQEVQTLKDWKAQAEKELKQASIRDAVAASGLTGDRLELLQDHVQARYADKIKVDGRQAYIVDGEEVRSLADYVKAYTAKNDLFKPASTVPVAGIKGNAGLPQFGGRPYSQLTKDELSKIPLDEQARMAGAEMQASGLFRN